ncbi:hypothetical protein T09_1071 [Trichinella sp. T9]|nr:hypothetical protein T09_1071 [Trichinella sp. T9]
MYITTGCWSLMNAINSPKCNNKKNDAADGDSQTANMLLCCFLCSLFGSTIKQKVKQSTIMNEIFESNNWKVNLQMVDAHHLYPALDLNHAHENVDVLLPDLGDCGCDLPQSILARRCYSNCLWYL